mgnify:CR=1 FL=1
MLRTIILSSATILILLIVESGYKMSFNDKPDIIAELAENQENNNEKYITAQLLSSSLDRVYNLFELNLAESISDKKNESSSIDFLDYLTDLMNDLEIKILSIEPKSSIKKRNNIYNPYEVEIKASYEKFGKLILNLEKSRRLIEIGEINLNNGLERIRASNKEEQLLTQDISLVISTITLN